jgi:LacI family transcriptional regulator
VSGARVLVVLGPSGAWSRGILRGFTAVAHEQGWNLLHYVPSSDLDWLARVWSPAATVIGPEPGLGWPASLRSGIAVSVNADRTGDGIASVCLDEEQIGRVALEHLMERGLRQVSTFRFDKSPFAVAREDAFHRAAVARGARVEPGWWVPGPDPSRAIEDPAAIATWLRALHKPCGVFAPCDAWGRVVARYARATDLRIPEDISIVGVDNDTLECELTLPPLSSVVVPWQSVGRQAARLLSLALAGQDIAGRRAVIAPAHVMTRRSSDALTIEDPIVARAVRWIHQQANGSLTVPAVARAVATSRRRLERRFHAVLGRTVLEEIRRVRVENARRLLSTTTHDLTNIARLTGFTSAALLSVAFHREIGLPPGAYRRRVRAASGDDD